MLLLSLSACVKKPSVCGIPEPPTPALIEIVEGSLAALNPGTELWVREIFRACQWGK